jgi:hypothetical protein
MHHEMTFRLSMICLAALGCAAAGAALSAEPVPVCIGEGGGRLEMHIAGDFEATLDWGNEGTRCDGGPRPRGDALRLMFAREDQALLVVIAVTGLERGTTGENMGASLTVVREGLGHFYGSMGADACVVTVDSNVADPSGADRYLVSGHGRCTKPIGAIAREGEITIDAFAFTGVAWWPEEDE